MKDKHISRGKLMRMMLIAAVSVLGLLLLCWLAPIPVLRLS